MADSEQVQNTPNLDLNLDAIPTPPAVSNIPSEASKKELDEWEKAHKHLENVSLWQTIRARKRYTFLIFLLVCAWLAGVYLLLLFQGFSYRGFSLSDTVLLAAIGSTTANIIGILLIIVNYLFPNKKSQ